MPEDLSMLSGVEVAARLLAEVKEETASTCRVEIGHLPYKPGRPAI